MHKRCGSCELAVEGSCYGAKCYIESQFVERLEAPGSASDNSLMVPCRAWCSGAMCFIGPDMVCGENPCQLARHQ